MVPETYNSKGQKKVRVCKCCNHLATKFRLALQDGNYDLAERVYMTGNVNLRCPFLNVNAGSEIMIPIHCAVEGGNLHLLKWLVDKHYCPIKMINTGNKRFDMAQQLIETSEGRSVLDIAIDSQSVEILQYLVQEKGVSIQQLEKNNKRSRGLGALEAVLRSLPDSPLESRNPTSFGGSTRNHGGSHASPGGSGYHSPYHAERTRNNRGGAGSSSNSSSKRRDSRGSSARNSNPRVAVVVRKNRGGIPPMLPTPTSSGRHREEIMSNITSDIPSYHINQFEQDDDSIEERDDAEYDADDDIDNVELDDFNDDESVVTTIQDPCVICYERTIDCVLTPCGHQICCLQCSRGITRCPICSASCQSIKIFKP